MKGTVRALDSDLSIWDYSSLPGPLCVVKFCRQILLFFAPQ